MRVLIVEDEPVIALEIESIVLDRLPDAEIVLATSVCQAFEAIGDEALAMALLDIDVTDGKTYPLALKLHERAVPFVFVSGADRSDAPACLCKKHLIPKPFSPDAISRAVDRLANEGDQD